MKDENDVEALEKTIGQLNSIHREISLLSKKSPNDAVNPFKLKIINQALEAANLVLGEEYQPIAEFEKFDIDDAPSTSDVVFIIAQYMEEVERFRSDNVTKYNYKWVYLLDGKPSDIEANMPQKR